MKKAIVHYRDDLDLQNLMDYIQKEVRSYFLQIIYALGHMKTRRHQQSCAFLKKKNIYIYIFFFKKCIISAVKWLFVINRILNKFLFA